MLKQTIIAFGFLFLLTGCTNQAPVDNITSTNKPSNDIIMENPLPPAQQPNLLDKFSQAIIHTNVGDITLEFYQDDSPITVNNWFYLASIGFYDNTKWHRVIPDFMIQGGDPISKTDKTNLYGTGGPGYRFTDEFNNHKLVKGSLAMANSGANTNGSQFFIVTADSTPWLDGQHTNFGKVIDGLDVAEKISKTARDVNDKPLSDIIINTIELK
ncbi:MAG: peptidylprolyl isomerase [Candidatus Komeilibacteria bacterium]